MAGYIWPAFGIVVIAAGVWLFYTLRRVGMVKQENVHLKKTSDSKERQLEAITNAPQGEELPDKLRKGEAL